MTNSSFSKLRVFFWPVHKFELKKVLPMFFLFFLFNFIYMILKDIKEPLIVTAPGSGAEAIPFLKMWGVLPLALIFMLVYTKLSSFMKRQTLFYTIILTFISFFAIFTFVLYPMRETLHPTLLADKLKDILPEGFFGIVAIFRNWTYALFYGMADLWGSVAISFLFWGLANNITSISESKRFYALFGLGSSFAMMLAGPTIIYFSNIRDKLPANVDAWGVTLSHLTTVIVICGIIIMTLYWWINRYVVEENRTPLESEKKSKTKMSFKEAFSYLTKSRYLQLIALLVIGYAVVMSYGEVVWKSQLKIQFSNPNDYSIFRGYFSTGISIVTLIMFFIGGSVIRRLGWKIAALATPVVVFITAVGFFGFISFKDQLSGIISFLGATPLLIGITFGAIMDGVGKSFKYSLFDPTKEMTYIPLDQEAKDKGKAAIDVLVAKFAKAGGSFLLQGLIIFFGSLAAITPIIFILVALILVFWIMGVLALDKRFSVFQKNA